MQAIKFSYAHRPLLGDPDFNPDVENASQQLISKTYAELLRNKTDDEETHDAKWYGEVYKENDGQQTSQISVIGPNEDHVSVTR